MAKKKQRHLTLTDRTYIEQELVKGSSFTDIGKALDKDPSNISKKVKLHMEIRKASTRSHGCYNCKKYRTCTLQHMCGDKKCKQYHVFKSRYMND